MCNEGPPIRTQQRNDNHKLYALHALHALHAPEVECISKGKARKPYDVPFAFTRRPA